MTRSLPLWRLLGALAICLLATGPAIAQTSAPTPAAAPTPAPAPAAAVPNDTTPPSSWRSTVPKPLKICVSPTSPMVYCNLGSNNSNTYTGFDIEMIRKLTQRLNMQVVGMKVVLYCQAQCLYVKGGCYNKGDGQHRREQTITLSAFPFWTLLSRSRQERPSVATATTAASAIQGVTWVCLASPSPSTAKRRASYSLIHITKRMCAVLVW